MGTRLTFLGAAGTVTGSRFLLRGPHQTLLVDCGLFQGYKRLRLLNRQPFPIEPREIDTVILTHAHLDHAGYLPRLIREGFRGSVYATSGTRDLCRILLPDSGRIHEEDASYAARKGFSRHEKPEPLYTERDAEHAAQRIKPIAFHEEIELAPGWSFQLQGAGHILGAASAIVRTPDGTVTVSGDLGRYHDPIMRPPEPPPATDHMLIESTYGGRHHLDNDPLDDLEDVANRTFERDGVLLIPSFAVGRTQTVLHMLHTLRTAHRIPRVPIFVNSPLATAATDIYSAHLEDHKLDARLAREVFSDQVEYTRSISESKALNERRGPMVIIAGSGMATGGRILHHMKRYAPYKEHTLLFVGYQAGGTRGAALLAGADSTKIHGKQVRVRCEVEEIEGLSAHADHEGLLKWVNSAPSKPRHIHIVHGEDEAAEALRRALEESGHRASVPGHMDHVDLVGRTGSQQR